VAGYDAARLSALMSDLLLPLLGRPTELVPFEEVRDRLQLRSFVDRGVTEVPLDAIVGTLGRARDFNRAFLPREEVSRSRWEGVRGLAEGQPGFPPVELYRVGEIYFVVDGHHRLSVARALGLDRVEARVREFSSPVPVTADLDLRGLLAERGRAEFLDATGWTAAAPDELRATDPDAHARLLEHIAVHRYFRGLEESREISWREAVQSWRYTVYGPAIEAIRASGVLDQFPGRTETDLYLFTMDHLHYLRERFGPGVSPATALDEIGRRAPLARRRSWLRSWLRAARRAPERR